MDKNIKFDKNVIINIVCTIISIFLVFALFGVLSAFAITKSINNNLGNEKIEKVIDSIDLQKILEDVSFYDEYDNDSLVNQLNIKSEDYKQLLSRYKESGLTFGEELVIMLKEKLSAFTDTTEMNTLEDISHYIKESGQFNLSEEDYYQEFEGNKLVGDDVELLNEILSTNYRGIIKIIKRYATQMNAMATAFTGNAISNMMIVAGVIIILLQFAAQRSFIKAFPWIAASFVPAAIMLLVFSSVFSAAATALVAIPSLWELSNQLISPISRDLTTFTVIYFVTAPVLIGLRFYLPTLIANNNKTL